MDKREIVKRCEDVIEYVSRITPQVQNGEINWILNGSVICNILCDIKSINGETVPNDFTEIAEEFVRRPKGDLDFSFKQDQNISTKLIDFDSPEIQNFYNISKERRTYNFIDHNSIINEEDLNEICLAEMYNGLKLYIKTPDNLFKYKLKDYFSAKFIDKDNERNKQNFQDISILYRLSILWVGQETTNSIIDNIRYCLGIMHNLYIEDSALYQEEIADIKNKLLGTIKIKKEQKS